MKIGVIGLGYLGLTHSVAMAQMGHEVFGIEVDPSRLAKIQRGEVPFFEPGLQEELTKALKKGAYSASSNYQDIRNCDLVYLCLGTPQSKEGGSADLSFLYNACAELSLNLKDGAVVAGKSTVPVGTARELQKRLAAERGGSVYLVWNPEFLREGTALQDSLNPDRIVIGGDDPIAIGVLRKAYAVQIEKGTPVVECDLETAELVKVAANAYLATKISFINAIAEIAEASGADTVELAKAIGYDERIGSEFLRTGIGFGGGCLPKDIRGFVARAEELGAGEAVGFLKEVDAINQRRREKVVELTRQELGKLDSKKVLMLGLSFKPDSDDIRDSPALDIALRLAQAGAEVTVHDPVALRALDDKHEELIREPELMLAARNQDLVILGTEWAEYRALDPGLFGERVANKLIIDGRNVLDVTSWQAAGWRLVALGRNVHN